MTAPLDIGMEQADAALNIGQDDVFDLVDAERGLRGGDISNFVARTQDEDESSNEGAEDNEQEEFMDTDDEKEYKVESLEAELDGLYEAYRGRLAEKDAKFKVKEARRVNKEREEWHGIQKDANSDDSEDSEAGGWDLTEEAKARDDGSSTDDSDEEEEPHIPVVSKKRGRTGESRPQPAKKARLVTKLAEPTDRKTDIWFSQDIFKGISDLDDIGDEDNSEMGTHDSASTGESDPQVG